MTDAANPLLRSAIFESIWPAAVEELCGRGREVSFEAGRQLFERGQDADELLIVREGAVDLMFPVQILGVTREVTMESAQAGDVLGWRSLVSPHCYTLSARSMSACTVTALSRDSLHSFFESDPHTGYLFMRNLAGVIGRRLQAMQAMWMRELQTSVAHRME